MAAPATVILRRKVANRADVWRSLIQVDRIFKLFRSGFLGKASPVHFFWGSFDLAVPRFSGRTSLHLDPT